MNTYYILMATGIVQGTFGAALLDMAKEKRDALAMSTLFEASLSARPCVGKSITPQVGWKVVQ